MPSDGMSNADCFKSDTSGPPAALMSFSSSRRSTLPSASALRALPTATIWRWSRVSSNGGRAAIGSGLGRRSPAEGEQEVPGRAVDLDAAVDLDSRRPGQDVPLCGLCLAGGHEVWRATAPVVG